MNSSFIFLPFTRFALIECVLSIRVGGAGWEEVEDGGGFCGTSRSDERGLSLFHSPCLPSFQPSHQTDLNSRRDTICCSSTTAAAALLGISPTHPSIHPSLPIYLHSALSTCSHQHPSTYSPADNAARWPLMGGSEERKLNSGQTSPSEFPALLLVGVYTGNREDTERPFRTPPLPEDGSLVETAGRSG